MVALDLFRALQKTHEKSELTYKWYRQKREWDKQEKVIKHVKNDNDKIERARSKVNYYSNLAGWMTWNFCSACKLM